jgi:hypothetical protein
MFTLLTIGEQLLRAQGRSKKVRVRDVGSLVEGQCAPSGALEGRRKTISTEITEI